MFAIAWQYLTGRAVATDPTDRRLPEWPPHPDRVIQALVAAWGERGEDVGQANVLRWLMALQPPELACPLDVPRGAMVKVFVPVNDVSLLPEQRVRQPRMFPSTNAGDEVCALVWSADLPDEYRVPLAKVVGDVTHIGHSSSLVHMWITDHPPHATLRPASFHGEHRLRVASEGRLDDLVRAYSGGAKGWRRPPVSRWQAYDPVHQSAAEPTGDFSGKLIVLSRVSGVRLGLSHAPKLVQALRGMLIEASDDLPKAKRFISGHEPDGSTMHDAHAALLPLAFVGDPRRKGGDRHAEGQVMGFALAVPKVISGDEEQELIYAIARTFNRGSGPTRTLQLGAVGSMEIGLEASEGAPLSLRPSTWTRTASIWATATPIALDRSPPRRHVDQDGWTHMQIAQACRHQGLPEPDACELSSVGFWIGAPSGQQFPALTRKDGSRRWHVHAKLTFPVPIGGPLVLGAGRYKGYGLLRPVSELP